MFSMSILGCETKLRTLITQKRQEFFQFPQELRQLYAIERVWIPEMFLVSVAWRFVSLDSQTEMLHDSQTTTILKNVDLREITQTNKTFRHETTSSGNLRKSPLSPQADHEFESL